MMRGIYGRVYREGSSCVTSIAALIAERTLKRASRPEPSSYLVALSEPAIRLSNKPFAELSFRSWIM